jgi:hypothetical protein
MAQITLYTHERPGAGLTSINVCKVKGAIGLRVITEGMIRQYRLTDSQNSMMFSQPGMHPSSGEAELRLQIAGQREVDLAKCEGAVALVIVEGAIGKNTTIYWIDAYHISEIEQCANFAFARSRIEARCCPKEYELPAHVN